MGTQFINTFLLESYLHKVIFNFYDEFLYQIFVSKILLFFILYLIGFVIIYYFIFRINNLVKWLQFIYLSFGVAVILALSNTIGLSKENIIGGTIILSIYISTTIYVLYNHRISQKFSVVVNFILGLLYLTAVYLCLKNKQGYTFRPGIFLVFGYSLIFVILNFKYLLLMKTNCKNLLLKMNLIFGVLASVLILYYIYMLEMERSDNPAIAFVYFLFFLSNTYIFDYIILQKKANYTINL